MLNLINETLKSITRNFQESPIKEAMTYALLGGGKRLRPQLMLAVLDAYHFKQTPYLDIACSIEMIHTYSLIHDDLPAMDDDDLRRGQPTVHKAFTEATAILSGDALLTDAFNIIAEHQTLDNHQKVEIIKILSVHAGSKGMVLGQALDIASENKNISPDKLKAIHYHKTAKLIEASLMIGAAIAQQKDIHAWQRIGKHLGLAFQMQDDLLDEISSEAITGKTLSDTDHQKATYVKVHGIEATKAYIANHFNQADRLLSSLDIQHKTLESLIMRIKTRDQ